MIYFLVSSQRGVYWSHDLHACSLAGKTNMHWVAGRSMKPWYSLNILAIYFYSFSFLCLTRLTLLLLTLGLIREHGSSGP
jgi:hypothetical protein